AGETMLGAQTVEYPLRRMALLARDTAVTLKPSINDRHKPVQLRALRYGLAPHLAYRFARHIETLRRRPLAHAIRASQTDLKIKFHAVDPHTSLTRQKGFKVDDFYAARSRTIPPLPWSNIAPPFSLYGARTGNSLRAAIALEEAGLAY
ncbi:hypothetical protein KXX17_001635, partial [Aspergillus fumigatus]